MSGRDLRHRTVPNTTAQDEDEIVESADVCADEHEWYNDENICFVNDERCVNSVMKRKNQEGCEGDAKSQENCEEGVKSHKVQRNLGKLSKKATRVKKQHILDALCSDPLDLASLQELAVSEGGLLEDSLRFKVWPKLLDLDPYEVSPKPSQADVHSHKDYTQVLLDVQRCLRRFPPGIPLERRIALQDQLTALIVRVLLKHPQLCYYQGYHDICVTVLLVLGEELGFAVMEKLSTTSLSVFMERTMESTVEILNYISPIVGKFSPKLHDHLEKADVSSVFCLSWLITWFGHVLSNYNQIVRLYDFFLVSHPLMPIYLAAAVVLHQQDQVLALEPDMAIIHHFLSNVPDDLPFEQLITRAVVIFNDYPPEDAARDAAKALQTQKGFRQKWLPRKPSSKFAVALCHRMRNALLNINPLYDRVGWRWMTAVTVILPIAFAIFFYSFPIWKNSKYMHSYS